MNLVCKYIEGINFDIANKTKTVETQNVYNNYKKWNRIY